MHGGGDHDTHEGDDEREHALEEDDGTADVHDSEKVSEREEKFDPDELLACWKRAYESARS